MLKNSFLAVCALSVAPFCPLAAQLSGASADIQADMALGLEPPFINTDPAVKYADNTRHFALATGITVSPEGRLYVAWFSGGDSEKAFMLVASSDDGGKTWSEPQLVIDPSDGKVFARRSLVGNIWTDPAGRLWLFFDQSMGFFDGRGGVWAITTDNPDAAQPSWSEPRRIWNGATLNKPTVLANGDWLLPVSLWDESKIRSGDAERETGLVMPKNLFPELDHLRRANVMRSRDQGKTWEMLGGVRLPWTDYDEHMVVEKKDGTLWMLARTGMGIYESFSKDGGLNWTEAVPSKKIIHIGARFFIRRLDSGNLLLVKHGRDIDKKSSGRNDLTAFISKDDGKTWGGGLLLDDRYSSYPDGDQAADGTIYITYDHSREGAAEIMVAKFREEDVLAGKFVTAGAQGRIIANKATGPKPTIGRTYIGPQLQQDLVALLEPLALETGLAASDVRGRAALVRNGGISATADGQLWASWIAGEGDGTYLLAASSNDGGKSWSAPALAVDPADGQVTSSRVSTGDFWTDPQGRLWLFYDRSAGIFDGRGGVWATHSVNPGAVQPQWEAAQRIWHGAPAGEPVVLESGEWLLPVSVWEKAKIHGGDMETQGGPSLRRNLFPELDMLRHAHVFSSVDNGANWVRKGGVKFPHTDLSEVSVAERKDGSLWMLARTDKGFYQSVSTDKGRTWSAAEPVQIGQSASSPFVRRLKSGNLLLVRDGGGKAIDDAEGRGLVAFISTDDGKSWSDALVLDTQAALNPEGFEAEDGTIYVSYTIGSGKDAELLVTRFTEADILRGKPVAGGYLRSVRINKAEGRQR